MTSRFFLITCIAAAAGCAGPTVKPPLFFTPGAVDHYGGRGGRTEYTLALEMSFERRPVHSQWIGMQLLFSAWNEPHGQRFVLERQLEPSATVFSYDQGLFGKTFHADVKTLVEVQDRQRTIREEQSPDVQRALTRGRAALVTWRKRFPEVAGRFRWKEDPRIIYYSPDPLRGRFGFYRTQQGTLFFEPSGQVRTDTLVNGVREFYRWHSAGKPDPVAPSNFFTGLSRVLAAYDPSPFPEGDPQALADLAVGDRWKATNTRGVIAFVGGVTAINQNLRAFLDDSRQQPFEMTFVLARRDGAVEQIESDNRSVDGDLGQGYRLASFRRAVRFDRKRGVVLRDMVRLVARHESGDRIEMSIELLARGD